IFEDKRDILAQRQELLRTKQIDEKDRNKQLDHLNKCLNLLEKEDMLAKKQNVFEDKQEILTRRQMLLRREQIDEKDSNKQLDHLNEQFDRLLMAEEHLKAQQNFYTWEQDLSLKIKAYEGLQAPNPDEQKTLASLKEMQDSLSKYRSYSQRCIKVANLERRI